MRELVNLMHMEKQEMEMKWKLEMKMEAKHCTNHWCSVFFMDSNVLVIFYLASVPTLTASLIPRLSPTYDFECLQYVKQMITSYPGPILHKYLSIIASFLGIIASFPTIASPSICQYRNTGRGNGLETRLD